MKFMRNWLSRKICWAKIATYLILFAQCVHVQKSSQSLKMDHVLRYSHNSYPFASNLFSAKFFSNLFNDVEIFAICMVVFRNYTVSQKFLDYTEQSYPRATLMPPWCYKLHSEGSTSGKCFEISPCPLGLDPLAIAGVAGLGRGNPNF